MSLWTNYRMNDINDSTHIQVRNTGVSNIIKIQIRIGVRFSC